MPMLTTLSVRSKPISSLSDFQPAMVSRLYDIDGQLIAESGDTAALDTTSLSSLTAGNVAATGGIASLEYGETFEGDGETWVANVNSGFALGSEGFLNLTYQYRDRGATNRAGLDGTRQIDVTGRAPVAEAAALGDQLSREALDLGAAKLLENAE